MKKKFRKILGHKVEVIKNFAGVYDVYIDGILRVGDIHIKSEGYIVAKEWIIENEEHDWRSARGGM